MVHICDQDIEIQHIQNDTLVFFSTWTPVYSIQISIPGGGLSPFGGHTAGAQALSRLDPRMLGRLCESYWNMQGLYQFIDDCWWLWMFIGDSWCSLMIIDVCILLLGCLLMIMDAYRWLLMFVDDYWCINIIFGMFIDDYGCLLVIIDVYWWLLMYKYYSKEV